MRCKTLLCHFQEPRGHGRSQGTGGRAGGMCVGISAFPAHSHSLLFSLHGVLRAFFWMPGVGSALLLTFAPCSWKFLGRKVRLYLGCAPRAPARVKFQLVTPVGPHVGPKPRRCWSCQELTAPCVLIILSLLGSSSQLPPPALCPSGWIPKARQRGWSSLRHPEHPGKGGSVQPQL